jgi:hypothetical protein
MTSIKSQKKENTRRTKLQNDKSKLDHEQNTERLFEDNKTTKDKLHKLAN